MATNCHWTFSERTAHFLFKSRKLDSFFTENSCVYSRELFQVISRTITNKVKGDTLQRAYYKRSSRLAAKVPPLHCSLLSYRRASISGTYNLSLEMHSDALASRHIYVCFNASMRWLQQISLVLVLSPAICNDIYRSSFVIWTMGNLLSCLR